ncbi:MAG: hypothetical protein LBR12_06520, partial [Opitutaceae bacterium]|nr:hypothetical protein [Opitutaceae bacterium]
TAGAHPDRTPLVAKVALNKRPHNSLEIPHAAIAAGGSLSFTLTADARQAAARGKLPRPFSLSAASA